MNVLVTGATGFIGAHLVPRLILRGDTVRVLVRPGSDASILGPRIQVLRGDITDANAIERAMTGCQIVYHLAKASSRSSRKTLESVNIEGTAGVARAAARTGVERLVHCSSTSVYGHGPYESLPLSEETRVRPDTPYGRSKAMAEQIVSSYADRLPVVTARITSVLGPRARGWLPFYEAVRTGRLRLIGSGNGRHQPAEVSDVVDGLLLCAGADAAKGRTYILAGPEATPLRILVQLIRDELELGDLSPRALPVFPFRLYMRLNKLAARLTGAGLPRADSVGFLLSDRTLDTSRAQRELGYTPRVGVRDAIYRTAQWYRTEGLLPAKRSIPSGAIVSGRHGAPLG
jgi:nucleoside-diphosphate-sugar epimerase